jgi:membrane associated rhomboid family serine protease
MYLSGIVMASLPSFFKHRNDPYYRALGASGGTAAILFSSVYFGPWDMSVQFYFIPIPIPSILFAVVYLIYSGWASKKSNDNIGHDAHFWGSVYGFVFTLICEPSHGLSFFRQLIHPHL